MCKVSVIVPATRREQIEETLAALRRQDYAGNWEILVVGPFAAELARRWPVQPVQTERVYAASRMRNLGAARAKGELLLFLDDDCLVAPDWLARNAAALAQPGVGAVGARLPGRSRAFFARCSDFAHVSYYQHGRAGEQALASGSLGVRRELFEALGGFDEGLQAGEDIELSYRIQQRGYRTLYRPEIVVLHDHRRTSLCALLRHSYVQGLQSGLAIKVAYREREAKNRLLASVRYPPLFLLLAPLIALAATARIVALNVGSEWRVLLYAPFVYLGKLCYEFGIFRTLLQEKQIESERSQRCA